PAVDGNAVSAPETEEGPRPRRRSWRMVMSTQPSQLRTAIHNYFREFGYDTCEIIYQELMRSGSLGGLLRRLGLDDPGFSDDQYAYVLNFLRRSGVQAFMDAMGRNKAPYRVQP